ncbi:MAG: hypothetical protein WAT23_18390 [Chromatiaceae bacterium]
MRQTRQRITSRYDVAEVAYCSPILLAESRRLGHAPLIDRNPRRGEYINFAPHKAERYKVRSQVERTHS